MASHAGTLHLYHKRLVAFEYASSHPSSNAPPNTLLWIGGLTDGLLTVPYPSSIAASLPPSWVLAEVLTSSSYKGWGTGSLARDARELGACVAFFKALRPGSKVVLMGHSTGCQDIMEYVVGAGAAQRVALDGAILQGGVSDREAWEDSVSGDADARRKYDAVVAQARDMIAAGQEREVMPRKGNMLSEGLSGPMTAYRTNALLARGGDDDYFSSDLPDSVFEGTFGKFPAATPVCFLLGNEDPYVPKTIDKKALLARWTRIIREGGGVVDDVDGGVVEGAHHNLDGDPEEVVQDLVGRVIGFLKGLERGNEWGSAGSRL
jgi:pimeloyl-ACP methyl ester carboxylesterase